MNKNLIACLMMLIPFTWTGALAKAQNFPEVTIPNTELRSFQSKLLGQELTLMIKLPSSYKSDEPRIYPVLYTTDANRSFPMVANIQFIVETQPTDFEDFVIVGIGYRIRDLTDWAAWRTRDLTPVNVPATDQFWSTMLKEMTGREVEVRSGGAEKFLDCIINEIIPFSEANYRVSKTDRGLAGYSYGGLFSLYALMKHPEVFCKYFAGSPSIGYGGGALFDMESEAAKGRTDLTAWLFMTTGSLEGDPMTGNMKKMAEQLQSRNYPGFKVSYHVFEDEDHRTCYPSALMRGIRELYSRQK